MIDRNTIQSKQEPDDLGHIRLLVSLRFTTSRIIHQRNSEWVEREEQRAKAEIWHHLYGDVAAEISELRRAFMYSLQPGAYFEADKAIAKMEAKLANPFLTATVKAP